MSSVRPTHIRIRPVTAAWSAASRTAPRRSATAPTRRAWRSSSARWVRERFSACRLGCCGIPPSSASMSWADAAGSYGSVFRVSRSGRAGSRCVTTSCSAGPTPRFGCRRAAPRVAHVGAIGGHRGGRRARRGGGLEPAAPGPAVRERVRSRPEAGRARREVRTSPGHASIHAVVHLHRSGGGRMRLLRPSAPEPGLRRTGRLHPVAAARGGASIFPRRCGPPRVTLVP
ncbi:hypothetical protein EV644_11070 [Kribbella orskensis]|uniref:Uncharacterized protein n=1 Tax=Kribbella orskensis TaxID=2512216 RepID=A0ABY2BGG3_9ACTN|nr:hypothetical protein EV642_11093 [Kribbella sp. VKM Ac-2500]TCO19422.1 hypothetical protein EV644_11070 [Kribbella orskensis]